MDIYTILDFTAVLVGIAVFLRVKNVESALLVCFFLIAAILSAVLSSFAQIYDTDLSKVWLYIFVGLPVAFGLLSRSHPIVLGYIAYLAVIGMNEISPLKYYSHLVYGIYTAQLIMAFYVRNNNHRGHRNYMSFDSYDKAGH